MAEVIDAQDKVAEVVAQNDLVKEDSLHIYLN
jgi:hypothetical protein